MAREVVRVAAVGDLHFTRASPGVLQPLLSQINDAADLLLLAGDLTDHGLPDEARALAHELAAVRLPIVAVLGNHDYESGQHEQIRDILADVGLTILDGDAHEVRRIGIAGVKGFAGGFGPRQLGSWGEPTIKQFVREAVNEGLKLEAALARLQTRQIVALMHYAPIQQTVEGEPPEIYPFVGSSRLEEPLTRFPVTFAVHGHAHRGQLAGATVNGVPVYNVSMPLLMRRLPHSPPFRVFDVPVEGDGSGLEETSHANR
jgi:Icc-related predicted phosphoesterase